MAGLCKAWQRKGKVRQGDGKARHCRASAQLSDGDGIAWHRMATQRQSEALRSYGDARHSYGSAGHGEAMAMRSKVAQRVSVPGDGVGFLSEARHDNGNAMQSKGGAGLVSARQ
jgi:hypothetical protein